MAASMLDEWSVAVRNSCVATAQCPDWLEVRICARLRTVVGPAVPYGDREPTYDCLPSARLACILRIRYRPEWAYSVSKSE